MVISRPPFAGIGRIRRIVHVSRIRVNDALPAVTTILSQMIRRRSKTRY